MTTNLVLVHALSPIHCGTGQAISGIDLPIARERSTGTPLIPGSTLKGVLRAQAGGYKPRPEGGTDRPEALPEHLAAFGPETANASDHAGSVQFADAHLLALPMRSVRGTFAWVTSPHLLRRLRRDLAEAKLDWPLPTAPTSEKGALVASDRLKVKVGNVEKVVLEDFDFEVQPSKEVGAFAEALGKAIFGGAAKDEIQHLRDRLCVVGDDAMRVLVRTGMEVTARNRIDPDTHTVAKGALWTEEALPAETILAGSLLATPVLRDFAPKALLDHVRKLAKGPIQLGGKATVGRGLCRVEVL